MVTVITVVFNAAPSLEQTISSVARQIYPSIEYVVIDGGSTDGTVSTIEKHRHLISYFASEADRGIYDAMNKGVENSTGEWILFLGAGDVLLSDASAAFSELSELPAEVSCCYGDVLYSDGTTFRSVLDWRILLRNRLHHQATLYRRRLFSTFRYDISFKTCADYELNLLLYLNNIPSLKIFHTIAICEAGGVSYLARFSGVKECHRIRVKHINGYILPILSYIIAQAYILRMSARLFLRRALHLVGIR